MTSIVIVRQKSMCGSPVAWALKTQERYDNLSQFGLLSPTSNSEVFFVLRSTQIGGYNGGAREFGGGSPGAILRLIGVLSHRVRNRPSLAVLMGGCLMFPSVLLPSWFGSLYSSFFSLLFGSRSSPYILRRGRVHVILTFGLCSTYAGCRRVLLRRGWTSALSWS